MQSSKFSLYNFKNKIQEFNQFNSFRVTIHYTLHISCFLFLPVRLDAECIPPVPSMFNIFFLTTGPVSPAISQARHSLPDEIADTAI